MDKRVVQQKQNQEEEEKKEVKRIKHDMMTG